MTEAPAKEALLQENQQLRARLEELEETLHAIRSGEVDALVVSRPEGEQVYTLKGALEPYRIMVENMSEGAVTLTLDSTISYCNGRFAELVRTKHEQIVGSPLRDYVAELDRDKFDATLARAWKEAVREELVLKPGDGTWLPTHLSMCPLPESEGKGIAAVITDLTEVANNAEAWSRLALIVSSSDDAIISTTLDGTVESWNPAAERLFGYTAEEAVGRPIQLLIVPQDRADETTQKLETIRRGERMGHIETVRMRKDGTQVDVSATASPIRDARNRIVGMSLIMRDVSERMRTEKELRKYHEQLEELVGERTSELEVANKELESFAYSVSHDLRTPLRAIDGFSSQLLKRYPDKLDDEGKRYLSIVRDNAQKMGQLIDDILAFSRMGRLGMSMSEINMEELAHAVFEDLKPGFAGRELTMEIKPLPLCHGDLPMLRQVWVNLLNNAIKFTQPRAAAHIEAGGITEGAELVYYVKDNGVGFDMQYVEKLFGVFQRLHSNEEFEGTGIGLAIVKRIVTRHGGRVWAEGKVDEGATFYFTLPVKGGTKHDSND